MSRCNLEVCTVNLQLLAPVNKSPSLQSYHIFYNHTIVNIVPPEYKLLNNFTQWYYFLFDFLNLIIIIDNKCLFPPTENAVHVQASPHE